MKNRIIVDTCAFTYSVVVRDFTKNKSRAIVTKIKQGSKVWDNCLAFHAMALKTKETIYNLMEAGLYLFPAEWCKQKFGRPYLPFNVLTGERIRNRLYQECVQENPRHKVSPEVEVDRVMIVLKLMNRDDAIALVKEGVMVGTGTESQKIALARLRGKDYTPDRLSVAREGDGFKHTGTSGAEPSLPF